VLEDAHRVVCARGASASRVALPHPPAVVLLAREPRAPRRRPARAVLARAVEDRVGVADLSARAEADRAGAALERLAVGYEDPAAVVGGKRRGAVGSEVPLVVGPRDDLTAAGDETALEALGQPQPVGVDRADRAVGLAPRSQARRRTVERAAPERRPEAEHHRRTDAAPDDLAPSVDGIAHGSSR